MAATQGLLAAMVAHTAPADLIWHNGLRYVQPGLVASPCWRPARWRGLLWDQLARATLCGHILASLALGGGWS